MKWLYNVPNSYSYNEDGSTSIQSILLRPVWTEHGKTFTSGIVQLNINALEIINQFQRQFEPDELAFFKELNESMVEKDYGIYELELNNDEKRYYLNRVEVYVIKPYTLEQLLHWSRLYLAINGYPCTSIEETTYDDFALDVNPIFRAFDKNRIKKFENRLGYDEWRSKYKRKSDTDLIETLIRNISKN
jgi:hypothetical protein